MRRADVEVLDVVALLHLHPHHPDAAAVLLAVGDQGQALDVAGVGERDHHLLVGDHVLDVHVALEVGELGPAFVAVALVELVQLLDDHGVDSLRIPEDRPQLADQLEQLGVLGADLVGLERGEPREAHVEDRLRLDLRERELLHQAGASDVRVVGRADQLDHRVEIVERDQQSLEDVRAGLRSPQLELRPSRHHLALVADVVDDQLLERQRLWHAVDERDHVDAEGVLHRRVLVELVEHHLGRVAAPLELDHEPHP